MKKTYDQGVYAGASSEMAQLRHTIRGLPNGGQLDAHPLFISVRYEVSKTYSCDAFCFMHLMEQPEISILFYR